MVQIDIQMPSDCYSCLVRKNMGCKIANDSGWLNNKRDDNCPLKEHESKTGTWQWKIHGKAESGGTLGEAVCDQCGKSTYATAVKGDLNYCPNCGAKMTGRR